MNNLNSSQIILFLAANPKGTPRLRLDEEVRDIVEGLERSKHREKFELIQSNCDQIDQVSIGSEINVNFNLKGRKWTDKQGKVVYFNSLQAWRVEVAQEQQSAPGNDAPMPDETWMQNDASSDDDLPF